MALTDAAIRKAKPEDKAKRLVDTGGLHLFLTPAGGKLWRLRYKVDGREKLLSLGAYPQVSLADAEDAGVKVRHLLASEITFASLLTSSADATVEAARQLDLRKVRRDFIQIKVPSAAAVGIDLGDTVMVRVPLLGLDDGKLFVVTRMIEELDSEGDGEIEAVTLELWG